MNILYLNNVMDVGGVEKCIIKLSKHLKENNKIIVMSKDGPLVDELKRLDIKHYSIIDTDSKNIKTILLNIIKIRKVLKEENIDIVHSHHRMTTMYCKILSKFNKFKLVHTQHLCIEDKVLFTNILLKNIRIITVSNGARANLIEKYRIKSNKITTVYNTIEKENENNDIDDRLIRLKKENKFIVGHISRLVEYKGIYDFIEIAKRVSKYTNDIKFVIIGDGEEKEKLIKCINENNLEDVIFYLGKKSNVINQLKYIDLLLLCSYIEGLPLTPIEAFFRSVPVIATNIKGTNEEIENGVNGYLINVKDIEGFANKILEIYENKNIYSHLKNGCYKVFNDKFDEDRYINEHKKIYEDLNK